MATEIIRDNIGRKIGSIVDQGSKRIVRDESGTHLGYYCSKQDQTRTNSGKLIGEGEQLGRLL